MSDHARLRVAVVGPTHPFKGGVAAHTTALAHELEEAGHEVALVSWSHLYPSALYPGEQTQPAGSPDVAPFPATTRPLSWARPDSWWRTGRSLRGVDVVVVVHVVPAVVPAHLALIRALRGGASRPTVLGLVHNVLPHETRPGDEALMRRFLGAVDAVLVHSAEQAAAAHRLGASDVSIAQLPPHLPGGDPLPRQDARSDAPSTGPVAFLALGIVRDYKGLDLVLEALREVPDVRLTIAGELWGAAGERVRSLAGEPGLAGRVELRPGYLPADEIAPLLARHDVLVLAYRSATGSQNVLLAQHHGLPVLVTDVGTLAEHVRDDVDGIVVPPEDHEALVAALRRLSDREVVERLRAGVRPPDLDGPWARYVAAIETVAAVRSVSRGDGTADETPAPRLLHRAASTAASLAAGARTVATLARPDVDLHSRDLPEWVRPTDILTTPTETADAVELARSLGLPRSGPRGGAAAWVALGALSAVLRVRDGDRRSSVIVDPSGPSSLFTRWARAIGYAPVALDPADHAVDPGALDVVALLHPRGCAGTDLDGAFAQSARLLRRGGLLTLTVPVSVRVPAAAPPRVESARLAVSRGRHTAGRALSTRGVRRRVAAFTDRSRTVPAAGTALLPADLRAAVARADTLGLALVGDLDRDIAPLLGSRPARSEASSAYGLARLTFRRR